MASPVPLASDLLPVEASRRSCKKIRVQEGYEDEDQDGHDHEGEEEEEREEEGEVLHADFTTAAIVRERCSYKEEEEEHLEDSADTVARSHGLAVELSPDFPLTASIAPSRCQSLDLLANTQCSISSRCMIRKEEEKEGGAAGGGGGGGKVEHAGCMFAAALLADTRTTQQYDAFSTHKNANCIPSLGSQAVDPSGNPITTCAKHLDNVACSFGQYHASDPPTHTAVAPKGPCKSIPSIPRIAGIRRLIRINGHDSSWYPVLTSPSNVSLELNLGAGGFCVRKSLQDIHSEELGGFHKWKRPKLENVVGCAEDGTHCWAQNAEGEQKSRPEISSDPTFSMPLASPCAKGLDLTIKEEKEYSDLTTVDSDAELGTDVDVKNFACQSLQCVFKLPGLTVAANVQEKSLVEFLRAKKQHKEHFLDKLIISADVYHSHPWLYTGGDLSAMYLCCTTKYTKRGNMTRDRMTRDGGRWKQQGMLQPIPTSKGCDAALKTYLSYIPRGKANCAKGYFIHPTPGRVKHRHRMIEIALEEDLKSEKRSLKHKVTPRPFLVVCVLKKP